MNNPMESNRLRQIILAGESIYFTAKNRLRVKRKKFRFPRSLSCPQSGKYERFSSASIAIRKVEKVYLDSLLALNGVGEFLIGLGLGVSLDQASNGLSQKLQVIKRVVSLDSLVQVRVESYLLDVLAVAKFDEGLTGTIVGVEDLLQSIKNEVSGSVSTVVLLDVCVLDIGLCGQFGSSLHDSKNFLSCHSSRLGSKVDTLTGAFGDVSGGITDKGDTSLDTAGAVVFGDGVSLNLDDLSSGNLVSGTFADGLLVLLDRGSVDNSTSSNTNVVVLGEDPSVEIGGNIISDVHFSHLFVELHLLLGDLNTLLEGNSEVVLSGIHGLSDTRVGTIGSDDDVDIHGLGNTDLGSLNVFLVVESVWVVRGLVVGGDVNASDETVHALGTVVESTLTEVSIHNFTTAHTNVFVGFKSVADVDLDTGGGDEVHHADLL
jgi:hypothetical protein